MTVLEQIRLENPNLALIPDDELVEQLLDSYTGDLDPEQYVQSLTQDMPVKSPVEAPTIAGKRPIGAATDPSDIGFGEAFTSGLKSNWQRTWGPGITYLRGGIAGLMGDEERSAELYSQAAQQDRDILDRSGYISFEQAMSGPDAGLDTFVKAGLYATGMSIPYTLFGGAGALAGRALLGQAIGKTAATMTGFTAGSLPVQASFNLSRQQEQVEAGNLDEVNEAAAFGAALPQAILETALFPVVGRLLGPLSRTQFSQVLSKATLGRVAKGTATAGVTEAITEVGQQAIERYQAGLPIDNEDAIREYKEAAAAGAFVGGLLGGATTVAGETARAVQPKPKETPVDKPVEAPKVEKGVIQDTTVTPEQIDTATEEQVKTEQAKPKNFVVEKQGEKFALKRQDLDTTGNVSSIGTVGTFNTEAEATAEQQKQEDQKNKLTEQTYFTKEAIVKENPTVGNLINELEDVGNTIAPHVQQVYFQKNIALPKGNLSNVKASGGNEFSVVDGWYDRTSDLAAISLIDQSKALETTAHENFHALQRQIGRGYQSGLFLEAEQKALDTFLPGGKVSELAQPVQRGLGKDVMQRLQERHGENILSNREMQAYAFGAYTTLKSKKKNLAAPNPVIRAFNRLFELVKRAGNVFRKNKINNVNQLFEKARTGEIGKRAKPKEGVEQLRKEALAREDKKELSLTTVKTDKGDIKSIIPNIDPNYGEEIIKTIYNRGITGNRLLKMQVARRRPEQKGEAEDVVLLANNEQQLLSDKEYIIVRDDVTGATARIGDASGRNVSKEYGTPELTRIGKAYARAVERAPGLELALSTVPIRKKPPKEKFKKVGELGKFFDDKQQMSDPMDDNAFKKAVKETAKEVEFQKDRVLNGIGWYSKDAVDTLNSLEEVFPSFKTEAHDKDLFAVLTAITSVNRNPRENVEIAARIFDYYKRNGVIPVKNPSTNKFWSMPTVSKQLTLLQYMLDKFGIRGTIDFVKSEKTIRQLAQVQRDSGKAEYGNVIKDNYLPTSKPSLGTGKGLETNVLGTFIFGPKVGRFYLDVKGIKPEEAQGVTKDVWFSRSFYRQFGQLTDKTPSSRDGLKGAMLKKHEKRGDEFAAALAKETNLTPDDAQAALWYYEHELYADTVKQAAPLYTLSDGAKKFIDKFKKDEYAEIKSKSRNPSVEVGNRIERAKGEEKTTEETRAREEEKELSVSEQEQIQKMAKTARRRGEGQALKPAIAPRYLEDTIEKGEDVLSIGAGFGQQEKAIADKGFKITAEDKGADQIAELQELGLFKGSTEELIAKGKRYDTLLVANVINVQESSQLRDKLMNDIYLLIKPRGRLIINLSQPIKPGAPKTNAELKKLLEDYFNDVTTVELEGKNRPNLFEAKNRRKINEVDTLSRDTLIENNLEFAVTDRKYEEGTQRVQATVNPKKSRRTVAGFWKQFKDKMDVRFHQGLTDQYISVKKFIGDEPYKALTMTYGSSGATESALLYGVPFMDKDGAIDLKANTLGKGLFSRLEKLGPDLTDFLTWVASNRAKAIYDRGMEAGLSSRADVIVAIKDLQKGREKKFNEGLKDLQEFNNAFLDIAVKSGYLDPQSRKAWTEVDGFNFYIPFYRLLDDSASNSGPRAAADIVNQKDYPALRGSDLPVNDLLNNLIQNYAFLTEASLKNVAGLKTLEKGATMGVTRQVKFPSKTSVFVRKNGKKVFYEVDEPLVLQSLTALNWNGWQNPAMGTLRQFKRFLTYGVTASPAFRIRNLIRDSVHSVAVGKLKVNPLGNVLEGFKGLSKDKNKQASELRARLGFGGGSIHFGHIYGADPNASEMLLNRQIDANTIMKSNGWGAGARKLLYKQLGGAAKWWEDVGAFSENVNRAALYKQLRDKGVSHFEASYQARDLLNFSRHGANPMVRFLTQSVPFLNARLQGLDKLVRAMGPEQRAQLLAVLGTYSLASIGLYLMYKDDEDFKQREQWDRDTYHWFKIPGTEGVFRIPRPFEVGAIGVIFERMVEQMVDDDVHGSVLAERIAHVITETFAFDIRPQLLTPALEVYSNKDSFTDRPIEGMAFRRLPPTERKYAYTSSAYVNTSKILNTISFNAVKLSPVQIEHLVQGYFGWVGSTVAAAVSLSDYPRQFARFTSTGWDTPLAMGFFKSLPSVQSKYKTQFYDQLSEMREVFALQRLYESRGEWDKAMKVATEQKNLLMWRTSYNRVNRKIQQINKQIRLIEANKKLSNAEIIDKVRQLNVLKNDIIRALIEQVLEYEKKTGERVKRERWFTL